MLCATWPQAARAAGPASTFDTGPENWQAAQSFFGTSPVEPPDYFATGGNPGGYIRLDDGDSGSNEQIAAFENLGTPFAGDRSGFYGGLFKFDLQLNGPGTRPAEASIGVGSTRLVGFERSAPGTTWRTFSKSLLENSWRFAGSGENPGPHPTKAQFKRVLAHLSRVAVIGDYQSASGEFANLDNVRLVAPHEVSRHLTLSYSLKRHRFKGRLSPHCFRSKHVLVRKARKGPDRTIRKVTTSGSGRFELEHHASPGVYYARAKKSFNPPAICRPASSTRIVVPQHA